MPGPVTLVTPERDAGHSRSKRVRLTLSTRRSYMKTAETGTRLTLKNILFLTDFSEPSEAALPFAVAMAREYGATIHVLHVLTPAAYSNSRPEVCFVGMEAEE